MWDKNISIIDNIKFAFSFSGRLGRLGYWTSILILLILWVVLNQSLENMWPLIVVVFIQFLVFFSILITLSSAVQRLHDQDLSAWYLLAFILPFAILYFGLFRGAKGTNRFGPDPLGGNESLLLFYAANGNVGKVKYFVELGEDANKLDEIGNGPLHYAVMNECFDVVEYLLGVGANKMAVSSKGLTPIDIAKRNKWTAGLQLFGIN